jgi:signal transduction histidine kinase/ligand-binding sensor domain-containing protein/DNA-binding response OmpR family regulator
MRLKAFISVILLFLLQQCLYAQKNIYKFSRLDIADGLSNNRVNCLYQDLSGFMWFGTPTGLNRYDGYKFKVFKHKANENNSLVDNYVIGIYEGPDKKMWVLTHKGLCVYSPETESFSSDVAHELQHYNVLTDQLNLIKKDASGDYWFLTENKGAYCYHPSTRTTNAYNTAVGSRILLHSNAIADIVAEKPGFKWLLYADGVIDELNTVNNTVVKRVFDLYVANNKKRESYSVLLANDNSLWIYSNDTFLGVYCYNPKDNNLMHYGKDSPGISLNSNVINTIVQGEDNNLWVGTDHGGINLINMQTHKVDYLLNRPDDATSVAGNSAVVYKDRSGIIWVGTFKQGISYFHKNIIQFPLARHYDSVPQSLPYEDVNCFVEDAKGNLWIGSNGGGLMCYNNATKRFTRYRHNPADPGSLSNDVVVTLFTDHQNRLWAGTYFGGLERMEGDGFVHYRHQDNMLSSLSDDRVYSIMEDAQKRLWVGTFAGGLNILDTKTNCFIHPSYPMSSEYTAILYQDKQQNMWIGRDKGIDIIEKSTGTLKHYYNEPKNPNSLIANDVNCIVQDSRGLFWLGTKDGLSILDEKANRFINIDDSKGLPNNNIANVLEDNNGLVWLSTANGLASVKLVKAGNSYSYQIHKYDQFDGLQGKEYNVIAALKTRNGDLIFGGPQGFNRFNPENIRTIVQKPNLLFTDFQLFNQSVRVGDTIKGHVVLSKSITASHSLVLKHDENVFSIEFAACDYFNLNKISYQYKLEGFDKDWLVAPKGLRKATYTNLDADDYVFKVRAINTNNPDSQGMASLNIKILPPFWKSPLAYAFYLVMILCGLFYMRHRGILKIKRKFELMQEKMEAERKVAKEREEARRMHELDLMKIKFFTNVSHEFRTPLSLIISPIDNLIRNNDKAEGLPQLIMIKRNGKRLLNLVNQLLDFRKMEFNELKLNLISGDIIQFIKEACLSFTDMADQNHIDYLFDSEVSSLIMNFDHDKIERVLFNLLSNSFKFTSSGGHISVFVSFRSNEENWPDNQRLEIKIMDTGIGIAKEKQERIFDRFFQDNLPDGLLNQGSGIGLSISKEFVKMHDGDILVESEPGDGSCFTIQLPVGVEDEMPEIITLPEPVQHAPKTDEYILGASKKPVVLLIEDNADLRFYLKDNLKHDFNIIEAANGKDGWQKTLALHPDLIVSDISMPEMNGLDLCKKIRQDSRTCHIPIILLTALTEKEDQLAGTANGANDYITKPFNFEILLSKINGLLLMQQTLKRTYQKQVDIQANEIDIVSEDEKFLKNTLNCIEKNITNPNFSVEELSRLMSINRVSLYKRLLKLTGKTPIDCIKTIRLKRAVQLLEKSKLGIAGVAYEVGFNNPTYFSKVFKEEYGMLPSEYVNEVKKKEKDQLHPVNEFD